MKTLEELALGTADVAAITAKAIADSIEEVARKTNVFAQLFKPNRDLMGPNKPREIVFPKKSTGISVTWGVSPGSSVSPSSFAYSAVTIAVQKVGIQLQFTNEALEMALRDVIQDHIYEAGLEYAEAVDDQAQTILLDLKRETITSFTGGTVGTASNTPIIRVVSDGPGTIKSVDYETGTIVMTGSLAAHTVVVEYSNRLKTTGLWVAASNAGTLSAKDILRARSKMVGQYRDPDVVIINPVDLATLFFDSNVKLVDASQYGGREPLLNGELGKLFGMKVIMSTGAPEGVAILVDTKRLGYDVIKRELKGYREDKPDLDSVFYYFWAERNFGVVDDYAVAAVVNAASSDSSYPAA